MIYSSLHALHKASRRTTLKGYFVWGRGSTRNCLLKCARSQVARCNADRLLVCNAGMYRPSSLSLLADPLGVFRTTAPSKSMERSDPFVELDEGVTLPVWVAVVRMPWIQPWVLQRTRKRSWHAHGQSGQSSPLLAAPTECPHSVCQACVASRPR